MAASEGLREQIRELFGALGPLSFRNMFGGTAVFVDGLSVIWLVADVPYLKTDAALAADLAQAGSEAFVFEGKRGKPVRMSYWRLPDSALDDPDEALAWGRRALAAARAGRG